MMAQLVTLEVRSREQWRAWLEKNHALSSGVWLVFYKRHTGVKSIPYEDSVREALCFGWIDSLIKRLDDDRYALKVTPAADHEQVVGHQSKTVGRTQSCRPAYIGRSRGRTFKQHLRATTGRP